MIFLETTYFCKKLSRKGGFLFYVFNRFYTECRPQSQSQRNEVTAAWTNTLIPPLLKEVEFKGEIDKRLKTSDEKKLEECWNIYVFPIWMHRLTLRKKNVFTLRIKDLTIVHASVIKKL